jgi:hypothetical protein
MLFLLLVVCGIIREKKPRNNYCDVKYVVTLYSLRIWYIDELSIHIALNPLVNHDGNIKQKFPLSSYAVITYVYNEFYTLYVKCFISSKVWFIV